MAFIRKRKLYESLPLWIQRGTGLIPFGWLAGRAYRATRARDDYFNRASREEIHSYQEKKLGQMLKFATDQVPAYHFLRGAVKRFSPFDALQEFPWLDKDTLQANLPDYLPRDINHIPHYEITTGGTSGNQLKIYVDDVSQSVENAFQHRLWKRMGYTPRCRKATFRGVYFPHLKPGIFWQENPIYNEIQFSPYHMSEKNLGSYLDKIIEFRPTYLHGYPSAIDFLAEYVLRHQLQDILPTIRAAFLISEGFDLKQRNRIEKAFHTRVFSFYGHSERVVMGGECEHNTTYHQFPDYGILEIISEAGRNCRQAGERGEIVGTGFLNRALPLIRYHTGDYAIRCESRCECGRNWDRFADVESRWGQEFVVGQSGSRISLAALNIHSQIFDRVIRYQYSQEKAGRCEIRIMAAADFSEADRKAIIRAYRQKVGDELEISVTVVNNIPLTSQGKLKRLISTLT